MTILKTGSKKGFTLIEIMLAVVFLALGTLLIQEGYLRSATLFGTYSNSFRARQWLAGKMWELKESVLHAETPAAGSDQGSFTESEKSFSWLTSVDARGEENLYLLRAEVHWNEGNRPIQIEKEEYVCREEKSLAAA